jgi:hypothetical protein
MFNGQKGLKNIYLHSFLRLLTLEGRGSLNALMERTWIELRLSNLVNAKLKIGNVI